MKKTAKATPKGSLRVKQSQLKSNSSDGLRKLFVDELKDIYWAEKALIKAIPKMIKNATSEELVETLTVHLEETEQQVKRLEEVFASIGEKAVTKKCEAMTGLIMEAEEIMSLTERGMVRDAAIISAGQKVEHYEIATYGTLSAFAKTLGEEEAVALLQESLNEEKAADEKLTDIAESFVNEGAVDDKEHDEQDSGDTMVVVKRRKK